MAKIGTIGTNKKQKKTKTSVKRMGPCQRFACDFAFLGCMVIVTPPTFNMEPEMH